jgi:glycosyltransferase involved in cell wall biosynthesis
MPPARPSPNGRVLVVTPTYNEIESLEATISAVLREVPEVDILVVDDASPDGTGQLADRLAAAEPRVTVLHRDRKDGLGRAYAAGFAVAAERGYDVVVELDADGSHPPDALPAMLTALGPAGPGDGGRRGNGLVIGSRWVPGGRVVDWPAPRRWLSRGGNRYARTMLRLPVRDVTAGYRAWRMEALRDIPLAALESRGYCFQIDMTRHAIASGWGVVEVPITFTERRAGRSKMSQAIVAEAMWRVTVWGVRRMLGRMRSRASRNQDGSAPFVDIRQRVPPGSGR